MKQEKIFRDNNSQWFLHYQIIETNIKEASHLGYDKHGIPLQHSFGNLLNLLVLTRRSYASSSHDLALLTTSSWPCRLGGPLRHSTDGLLLSTWAAFLHKLGWLMEEILDELIDFRWSFYHHHVAGVLNHLQPGLVDGLEQWRLGGVEAGSGQHLSSQVWYHVVLSR